MNFKENFRPISQMICRALLDRSERTIVVLCATSIFLAMTTPRLHNLTNTIVVQTYLQYFHYGVAICAAFIILTYRPKYFLIATSAILIVIFHEIALWMTQQMIQNIN